MKNRFGIVAVLSFIISGALLINHIWPVRTYNMKYFTFEFFILRAIFIIGIISLIFFMLCKKKKIDLKKSKIIVAIISVILIVICSVVGYYGTIKDYDYYLSGTPFEGNLDSETNKFFLYNDDGDLGIKYDTCMLLKYLRINTDHYYMEYYETVSPLMNKVLFIENNPEHIRTYIGPPELFRAKSEKIERDGLNIILFKNKKSYEAVIMDSFSSFYFYVIDANQKNVTEEQFLSQAINQYKLTRKTVADNTVRDFLYEDYSMHCREVLGDEYYD